MSRQSFSARTIAGGRSVLVIDDVTTTGTTLRTAAAVLLEAGADAVFCAVCAFAPDTRRFP
jgi:predicted amidophosphoribosyltransferase